MKARYSTVAVTAFLLFAGCGGDNALYMNEGGSVSTYSVASCDGSGETYTDIINGDILSRDEDGTSIEVIHDSDDHKKVCVLSGSAHLIR